VVPAASAYALASLLASAYAQVATADKTADKKALPSPVAPSGAMGDKKRKVLPRVFDTFSTLRVPLSSF
jgi:hypothetical protein